MALNMYLKIGDIEGESTDQAHEGWIDVLSVSQSVTQPSSALASSGRRTSQRVIMQDFSVVKAIDKATPKLCTWRAARASAFPRSRFTW